ncbi:MAG: hypothetical protein JNM34_08380 [Chthonomonadaceae bacterium]|nr:hypothetical protein [Chthonomonadaceae bacterium]
MPQCRSPKCGRWADDAWTCCAHCGEPLRGTRPNEGTCDHDFTIEGRFCILCGFDPEVGDKSERTGLLLKGVGVMLVGLLIAFGSFFVLNSGVSMPEEAPAPRSLGIWTVGGFIVAATGIGMILKSLRVSS